MSKDEAFRILMSITAFFGMAIGTWIGTTLRELMRGITELNIKMAVIIDRVDLHELRIGTLEKRKK